MPSELVHHESALKPAAIVGLIGIALIHFLDVFDKFKETPYLGVAYVVLIGACLVAAAMLLRHDARLGWRLAFLAGVATFAGYVISRTTGLPHATDDIGNWTEPLGLASLFVEGLVATMSAYVLAVVRTRATASAPSPARAYATQSSS